MRYRSSAIIVGQLLALLLFIASGFAVAETHDVLKLYDEKQYTVSKYIHVYHDEQDSLTIEDIVALDNEGKFERNEQDILNFGLLAYSVWVRFDIAYPEDQLNPDPIRWWYIEAASPLLDIGSLYQQDKDGRWQQLHSDLTVPFDERELNHAYSVFPIGLNLGESKRIYLQMKTDGSFYVPINIWDQDAYATKVAAEEFIYGMFYGAMVCIVLFNLMIYLSVRDTSYLYYIAYLSCVTLLFFLALGHGVNIVDNTGEYLTKDMLSTMIWLLWIFVTQFIRNFLETKKYHTIIDSWLQLVAGIALAYLVMELLLHSIVGVLWGAFATPIITSIFIPMCIYMWRKGNENALFFLIAWSLNMAGLSIYAAVTLGLLPSNNFFIALAPLGILSEAVLLSLALAERVKRTQKALEGADRKAMSQLSRYQSVFNNALEGIYQLSLDGKFIRVNPSMARILGYRSPKQVLLAGDEAVGICYHDPKNQYDKLAQNHSLEEEITFNRVLGEKAWADHSARLIYDEYGEPSHIEGTFIDLTDRKKREDALRDKEIERVEKELAKKTADAKSEFLANMSHEIRTPLTSIIGHSELIKSLKLTGSERENAFRTISNSSQKLLKLINDILDYSKIEAKKLDIETVKLDIQELVGELRHTYEWQADQKGIKLYFVANGKIPKYIKTDPTRLKQILQNLFSNALKFTKEGVISVVFQWENSSGNLLIKVVDSGIGIPLDQQVGIFDIFEHGNTGGIRKYIGVGLGLPIAQQLAELLGGGIELKSSPGSGSEFTVKIKPGLASAADWIDTAELDHTKPKPSKANQDVTPPSLEGKVLLAEDNPVNQKLISKILSKTGVEVIVAENGKVAVESVLEGGIDMVLMDINMPVMDGLEATRIIKSTHSEMPVFALTAEIDAEELDKAKQAGCIDCLKKPVDRAQIYAALSDVLSSGNKNQ